MIRVQRSPQRKKPGDEPGFFISTSHGAKIVEIWSEVP